MPIEIKPVSGSWYGNPETGMPEPPTQSQSILPSSYNWLRSQRWDYDRYRVGVSPYRPGTIGGGLGKSQSQQLARWQQDATVPDPPRLDQSILRGQGNNRVRIGQLTLDMIDPFSTVTELTGSYIGREEPLVGNGGSTMDPLAFLTSKDIDFENAPSRLADYPAGIINAVADMLSGKPMPSRPTSGDTYFPFQEDPAYWQVITTANDQQLHNLAYNVTARYADPASNQYLIEKLYGQFKLDQDKMQAYSSGDARQDYLAKIAIQSWSWAGEDRALAAAQVASLAGHGLGVDGLGQPGLSRTLAEWIPLVGDDIASMLDPIRPETEAAWRGLDSDQRRAILGNMGVRSGAADLTYMLAGFSALGVVASTAKGAAGLAGTAYKAYDGLLTASKVSMAMGVTSAAANWALSAYWPEDHNFGPLTGAGIKEFTTRVDLSRPFSESQFAGVIDAMGLWSSGTYGAWTAATAAKRVTTKVGAVALERGIPVLSGVRAFGGMPDLRLYAHGLGGSDMARFATGTLGLSEQGIRVSAQRLFLSETLNRIRRSRFSRWAAAIAGEPTGTMIDDLDETLRVELAGMDMSRPLEATMGEAEAVLRTITKAREDVPLGLAMGGDDAIRAANITRRNARSWDDAVAREYVSAYGAPFVSRLAGEDSPAAVRAWLAGALDRLGLGARADALPRAGAHSLEWWHQLTRMVYHYSFDRWAGLVHHASAGAEEAGRINVMSTRHLFRDEADDALLVLRGEDEAAATETMERLRSKIEIEEWEAHEIGRPRKLRGLDMERPWEASPAKLADHIEDIYETLSARRHLPDPGGTTSGEPLNVVHAQMNEEGLWTLGYKPVNEAGDFVAAIKTRTGQSVQTHWLDYPLSGADNIEIGNRGFLSSKLDAVTRGFRTWRIVEYQRGSLFRTLTGSTAYSPTQIQAFHDGVMRISRKHQLSPQAVGRILPVSVFRTLDDEVRELARRVFGPGPHLDVNGKPIEWRRVIGDAYRQAYRLNATAGLTSHLKAHLGPVGEAIALSSDFIYVMWRFGMSPLFKGGELWESAQLNMMRRVFPNEDPWITTLYIRAGAGSDPGAVQTEIVGDMLAQGLGDPLAATGSGVFEAPVPRSAHAAQRRAATTLAWHARQLPEDHAQLLARAAMRKQAELFRARALGGEALHTTDRGRLMAELANSVDDAGKLVAGADEGRVKALLYQLSREDLDPDIVAALDAHPWGAPTAAQLAEAKDLRDTAASLRGIVPLVPAPGTGHVYYRGTTPGSTAQIVTGNNWWDAHLFVSSSRRFAADYGPEIETVTLAADARVLREGSQEFRRLARDIDPSLSMLDWATAVAQRADGAGWDAVHFSRQGDIGTIILNESKATRNATIEMVEDEAARMTIYRDLIRRGVMDPDPRLALLDRYTELIDYLVVQRDSIRAFKSSKPSASTVPPGTFDLSDPITGQPVVRDIMWMSEREADHALRSLRARKARIKVEPPSVDELALRLEAHADAVELPRPVFRSDRVGPEDALPDGFSTDPGDINVTGQFNNSSNGGEGVLMWLDLDATLSEDRGLFHATTALDGVLDTGLMSRLELINRQMPDDARAALRQAYDVDGLPPAEFWVQLVSGSEIHLTHSSLKDVIHGDVGYLMDQYTGDLIPFGQVSWIKNRSSGEIIWQRPPGTGVRPPEGLSASRPDRMVSTTTEWAHAETIAERLKMVSAAANDQATTDDILGHFSRYYDDLLGDEEIELVEMIKALHAMGPDGHYLYKPARDANNVQIPLSPQQIEKLYDDLRLWMDNKIQSAMSPGMAKWQMVKDLDAGLKSARRNQMPDFQGFDGSVILAGGFDAAKAIDPAQVGVVKLAARTHRYPPIDEATFRSEADRLYREGAKDNGIRVDYVDGGGTSFIRWQAAPGERIRGKTEAESFAEWIDEVLHNDSPVVSMSTVGIDPATGNAFDMVVGNATPWERRPRVGPDEFEVQFDSADLYVIDPRTEAEPLATDDVGLLRQLRLVVDENGAVIPGYEKRAAAITHDLDRLRQQAMNPDPVSALADIPETAEGITANLEDRIRMRLQVGDRAREWARKFWDPVPTKETAETRLIVQMQREEFPHVIAGTPAEQVFRELDIPEQQWADWLVQDRALLDRWQRSRDPEDLARLLDHAGSDLDRAAMDAFYTSEEWDVISGLWSLNLLGASEESFRVHFFDQYRSPLLRSINHPVLGVYPAAWAMKTAREWAKFLFDNRMFGVDLRLGMSPAVAISELSRAQAVAFAQDNPGAEGTFERYMEDGPLGSSIFVFNLLMPGDWSALPFPLARSLREVLRGNLDPGSILAANIQYLGVTRDLRLGGEMMQEWRDLLLGPSKPEEGNWILPVEGSITKPKRPPEWGDAPTR